MYVLMAMSSRVRVHKAILGKSIIACVETPHWADRSDFLVVSACAVWCACVCRDRHMPVANGYTITHHLQHVVALSLYLLVLIISTTWQGKTFVFRSLIYHKMVTIWTFWLIFSQLVVEPYNILFKMYKVMVNKPRFWKFLKSFGGKRGFRPKSSRIFRFVVVNEYALAAIKSQ